VVRPSQSVPALPPVLWSGPTTWWGTHSIGVGRALGSATGLTLEPPAQTLGALRGTGCTVPPIGCIAMRVTLDCIVSGRWIAIYPPGRVLCL
jgi:hypothetical protein